MATWKDNEGRPWRFDVNMWTCREVKRETGWDLPNILNDGMTKLSELVADKDELFSVFLVLVDKQLAERGMSPEDFGEAVAGDALLNAAEAFQEALADFFPNRQRQQLRTLMEKSRAVATALADRADAKISSLETSTLIESVLSGLESAESSHGS